MEDNLGCEIENLLILADIFSRLKYMERRGSGFKKIWADYEGQVEFDETKMPVFEADNAC